MDPSQALQEQSPDELPIAVPPASSNLAEPPAAVAVELSFRDRIGDWLNYVFRRERAESVALHRTLWRDGIAEEMAFWDSYLASRGEAWGSDYAERMDPALPLQEYLAEVVTVPQGRRLRILDVGAGPLTYVGKRSERWQVEIVAVDPLAPGYDLLLAKHGIVPPVRTQQGSAEHLRRLFAPNSFELVSARNSIDHGLDPLRSIRQMLAVVKPGCPVFLHHHMNEAVNQQFAGLHQWNLGAEHGDFILSSPTRRINVNHAFRGLATVHTRTYGDEWIANTIVKHRWRPI